MIGLVVTLIQLRTFLHDTFSWDIILTYLDVSPSSQNFQWIQEIVCQSQLRRTGDFTQLLQTATSP